MGFLVALLPSLVLVGLFLRTNSDEPVLVLDVMRTGDGVVAQSYRFRTTGRGSPAFQVVGRFLRKYGWDEFPALWSVFVGRIRLRQLLRLWRVA